MKVWLDDIRPAPEGWEWIKDYHGFVECINKNYENIEEISFDHDISSYDEDGKEKTGYDALVLVENLVFYYSLHPPIVHVHSANAGAYNKMRAAMDKINFEREIRILDSL